MKCVMLSIRPKWCELIADGKKTVEVRKTYPKIETPFRCFIYCTKPKSILRFVYSENDIKEFCKTADGSSAFCCPPYRGKVIGEFTCDVITFVVSHPPIFAGHDLVHAKACELACITHDESIEYSGGKDVYGWHISDLKIYDKPKPLDAFTKCGFDAIVPLKRPPQSWCYVDEIPLFLREDLNLQKENEQ